MQLVPLILLTATIVCSWSEEGWVYTGDLNGDGIDDTIESGAAELFGKAGGPFVISISNPDGTIQKSVVFAHPHCIAPEPVDEGEMTNIFIWTYSRLSNREGKLVRYNLLDSKATQSITIRPGDAGTNLGNSIYQALLTHRIQLNRVEDYTVPPHPNGHQWGK